MSNAALVHAFVAQLTQLLEYLEKRFPDDRDIHYTRKQLDAAASLSPRLVVVHFMAEVRPYMDELMAGNEKFFLHLVTNSYDDVLGHMDIAGKWSTLNEDERAWLFTKTQNIAKMGNLIAS